MPGYPYFFRRLNASKSTSAVNLPYWWTSYENELGNIFSVYNILGLVDEAMVDNQRCYYLVSFYIYPSHLKSKLGGLS